MYLVKRITRLVAPTTAIDDKIPYCGCKCAEKQHGAVKIVIGMCLTPMVEEKLAST